MIVLLLDEPKCRLYQYAPRPEVLKTLLGKDNLQWEKVKLDIQKGVAIYIPEKKVLKSILAPRMLIRINTMNIHLPLTEGGMVMEQWLPEAS